jgi:formylglycine-generating enzyme required for sulfatase activity
LPCVVAIVVVAVLSHAQVARSHADLGDAGAAVGELTASAGTPLGATTGANQTTRGATGTCAPGMVDVEGDYCTNLPEQQCLKFASATQAKSTQHGKGKGRCAEFAPSEPCAGPTARKHFCMDRFEYPNQPGENPVVMKNWYEARMLCNAAGKRLCSDSEWTLACEGPEHLPYPYGLVRDAVACNIDKAPLNPNEADLRSYQKRDAEAKRLWQGEPSGARAGCVSAYGVHDLTGNVDEWVVNETGKPHDSALKGGYWSWVRGRCRPTTDGHAEDFRYYQIGFRCCTDAAASTENSASATAAR